MSDQAVAAPLAFADSTALLDDAPALQARAARDGYLYLRDLLPRELVLALRTQFIAVLAGYGWIRAGTDPMDAIGDLETIARLEPQALAAHGVGIPHEAYVRVQKLELFHSLAHHPQLVRLYERLFGEAVLVHPRNIARLMLPAPSFTPTPAHQDFTHIQGTKIAWTCWVPIGDVSLALGGLSVLAGSHQDGIYQYAKHEGAGGLEAIICATTRAWHTGPLRAGDVLTFHSHTVHKANPNQHPERIRLSCDYRYQPASLEIEQRSLQVHGLVASWDELYQHWGNERLKYYWLQNDLTLSPWDDSMVQTTRKIC